MIVVIFFFSLSGIGVFVWLREREKGARDGPSPHKKTP